MSNVISIKDKLETWKLVYRKEKFAAYVSNHGRFKFHFENDVVATKLEFFDSVFFLKELSSSLEIAMEDMGMYNNAY